MTRVTQAVDRLRDSERCRSHSEKEAMYHATLNGRDVSDHLVLDDKDWITRRVEGGMVVQWEIPFRDLEIAVGDAITLNDHAGSVSGLVETDTATYAVMPHAPWAYGSERS